MVKSYRLTHVQTKINIDSPTEVTQNPMPKEDEVKWILDEVSHYLSKGIYTKIHIGRGRELL